MNQKTKKTTGRIAVVVAVILLMMTLLSSCATQQKTATIEMNEDLFVWNKDEPAHAMDATELKAIAKLIKESFSSGFDAREALVAASRGYDMTAESFDPKADFSADKGLNVAAAKNVINKANQTVADAKKDALSNADLDAYLKKWDGAEADKIKADVDLLIKAFQQKIEIEKSGFLDGILVFIGKILNGITNTIGFGSYVIGICVFAILIEVVMLPFSVKQQKNSIKQATLRPKEMAIKNKYKGRNDQPTMQKMQAEIQELYQRENFSPYSGCLPLLLQMPVVMALYYIVIDPLHYVLGQSASISTALNTFATASPAAGGLGMSLGSNRGTIELLSLLKDNSDGVIDALASFRYFNINAEVLSSLEGAVQAIPNFNIGGLNFGLTPNINNWSNGAWLLLLVPVLTFVTYFFSSKLNRKFMYRPATNDGIDARQEACSNSMMDVTMPAMSTFFTMAVPAVIGVYWAFRSWVGLLKSFIMARIMPLPTFTEEDYKAAEREMAGKMKKKKSGGNGSQVRPVRSLHYIDDEDFEDTRERGLARKAAIEEREKQEQEEKAQNTPFGKIALKKDDRADQTPKQETEETEATEAAEQSEDSASQETENNKE